MAAARIEVDTSIWPVVFVTPFGNLTDQDYSAMMREVDRLFARREKYLTIADTRHSGSATPRQRQMLGEWMKQLEPLMLRYSVGSIVIVESALVRGALTAIEWVAQSKHKSHYVRDMPSALEKASELLRGAGLLTEELSRRLKRAG